MTTALLKKAVQLPVPDRIKLVEDIWDSISEAEGDFLLTPAQKREIDRRLELMEKDPKRGLSWNEAKKRILRRPARG